MTSINDLVTDSDSRPLGINGECYYCNKKIGDEHDSECVSLRRKVRVRHTFEVVADVTRYWNADMINNFFNESGWCANNAARQLNDIAENRDECLCNVHSCEYLGEVTED